MASEARSTHPQTALSIMIIISPRGPHHAGVLEAVCVRDGAVVVQAVPCTERQTPTRVGHTTCHHHAPTGSIARTQQLLSCRQAGRPAGRHMARPDHTWTARNDRRGQERLTIGARRG
jgi:hypothetical protein